MPYQLYPKFSQEGEDKFEWHMKEKYNGSKEKMVYYTTTMRSHGAQVGVKFKFSGTIANTFEAHRTIQYFQEEKGPEVADKIVNCKRLTVVSVSSVDLWSSIVLAVF